MTPTTVIIMILRAVCLIFCQHSVRTEHCDRRTASATKARTTNKLVQICQFLQMVGVCKNSYEVGKVAV